MKAGHTYILQFDSGVLKVGATSRLADRMASHRSNAAIHGRAITYSWTSEPHTNYRDNERALIAFCADRWEKVVGEYFLGADPLDVEEFASRLPQVVAEDEAGWSHDRKMRQMLLDQFMESAEQRAIDPSAPIPEGHARLIEAGFGLPQATGRTRDQHSAR